MSKVAVINYGMGNLDSVARAVQECGYDVKIVNEPQQIRDASKIILPGVGAFPKGMSQLREIGFIDEIYEQVVNKRVLLLGICLGMQLLADVGYEVAETKGLGLISGEIRRFHASNKERIPHVGWNSIQIHKKNKILEGIKDLTDFYFVHSFHFSSIKQENIVATTHYCEEFPSIVANENIIGTQFHPEKSQKSGLEVLKNFLVMKC